MLSHFYLLFAMGWKTVIIGAECTASVSLNRLKITIENEYHHIPLTDIDTVIFTHDKVVITMPLLSKLIENNINIIICDSKNDPIGMFQPFNNHSLVFKQVNKQINWKVTRKKKLWKIIIEQKIQSEIEALQLLNNTSSDIINTLISYRNSVYNDDQTNREALSARLYYCAMFGKSFYRDEPISTNFAMNYGYKILASHISKCIASRGLLTQLGIHHVGESNPFNLTYDFIEPMRVLIDIWVKQNIDEEFTVYHKRELIELMDCRVFLQGKWIRLKDAIEDMIDSYIAFMNENNDKPLFIDLSKGIRLDVEED